MSQLVVAKHKQVRELISRAFAERMTWNTKGLPTYVVEIIAKIIRIITITFFFFFLLLL